MVTRDTVWPEGTPCWIDVTVPDVDLAREFYSGLFGWDIPEGSPQSRGYCVASLGGKIVAGIGPLAGPIEPAWNTYLAAQDADLAAAKVSSAGGRLVMGPVDVMDRGRFAVAADTSGAVFGIWQGRVRTGIERANEPGSLIWNEQMSQDFEGSKAFYHAVFGYEYGDLSTDDYKYASLDVDGRRVAGIGELGNLPWPAFSGWTSYFSVTDPDATMALAVDLGGTIVAEARATPFGRIGSVTDNQGAIFSLITMTTS